MRLRVSTCISVQVQVREPLRCCISALVGSTDELLQQCTEFKTKTADCVGGKGGRILDSDRECLPHCNVIKKICTFS